MKREEKDLARKFRAEGMSMNEIVKKLGVSKASVSVWVRDIPLTKEQRKRLTKNGFSVDAIEKRRVSRIEKTASRHEEIIISAKEDIAGLTKRELFLIGTALYWGEGGKTNNNLASVANADPHVIKFMMRFFREVCLVPELKFRGHVHTFSHLNANKAEEYWAEVSGIPRTQFYKTYSKPSVAGSGKRDSLPYGTFQIYVCDTNIFLRIKGWIEKIAELGASGSIE